MKKAALPFTTISVVGLGLMGTSLIEACEDAGAVTAYGMGRNPVSIQKGIRDKVLADGAVLGQEDDHARKLLAGSDLIVLAMYPSGLLPFIETYRDSFSKGTIVIDICGLKGAFVDKAQALMPERVEYIGTHPMAGRETSGYDAANSELFLGTSFLIAPTDKNTEENIDRIIRLAKAIGCARIRKVSPEEHDVIIAYTSHMPHVLASSLINCWNGTEDIASFTGGSFRDATRVAQINSRLWTQLFLDNKGPLMKELDDFQKELDTFKKALAEDDAEAMNAFLDRSCQRKTAWNERRDRYHE